MNLARMMHVLEIAITKAGINLTYLTGKYSPSVNDFAEKQFSHLQHILFIAKSKISCLRAWRAYMLGVFTCTRVWRVHVPTCLLVKHACLFLCPYLLTCLTCLLCSNTLLAQCVRASLTSFVLFSSHLKSFIETFLFIQRSIQNPPEHL